MFLRVDFFCFCDDVVGIVADGGAELAGGDAGFAPEKGREAEGLAASAAGAADVEVDAAAFYQAVVAGRLQGWRGQCWTG